MICAIDIGLNFGVTYGTSLETATIQSIKLDDTLIVKRILENVKPEYRQGLLHVIRRSYEPRVVMFYEYIKWLPYEITYVVWEDILFQASGALAQQLWASLRTALWLGCLAKARQPRMLAIPTSKVDAMLREMLKEREEEVQRYMQQHHLTEKLGGQAKWLPKLRRSVAAAIVFPQRFTKVELRPRSLIPWLYDSTAKAWLDNNAVDSFWLWYWAFQHLQRECRPLEVSRARAAKKKAEEQTIE